MASLLSGFEYDIFISYRHNDNRTGWVRKFVKKLQEELAATVKEPLTIYFDENPHDGLLETDIVYDSLKDKLKCIIFIPILSQTYCDPKSFAWHHEFLVFKQGATADEIGLKIKQANGNFASRILPIRIHNLDADDQRLLEAELGPLRAIDFIFKSPGVNRPLAIGDNRGDNLNKTVYNDQVNKVANCIKEIITTLKRGNAEPVKSVADLPKGMRRGMSQRLAWVAGVTISLLIVLFAIYYFARPRTDLDAEPLERSIAVLAFDDLSEKHDQEYFSDGISEEIINALVKIEGLKVAGRTSSFHYRRSNTSLTEIGEKLNVALILEGSVRRSGNHLRITAQLVNAKNGYHLWSDSYDHELKDVLKAQDEVTKGILKELQQRLGINGRMTTRRQPTQSLEAYDLYWKGHQQFLLKGEHVAKAKELLSEAIRLDPDFAMAHAGLAEAYAVYHLGAGNRDEAIRSANRALAIDSTISSAYAVLAWSAARVGPYGSIQVEELVEQADFIYSNFERAIKLDPQNSTARLWFGITKGISGLLQPALDQLRIAVEIDPLVPINVGALGLYEYENGLDSIGFLHLNEGVKMGWKAGNQSLAFFCLEHQEWAKAEYYFNEHSKGAKMGTEVDYHQLVTAIQKKDLLTLKKITASIAADARGFGFGFVPIVSDLAGDKDLLISTLKTSEGVQRLMRQNRSDLRKMPGFRTFVKEVGLVGYWNKYGWPAVCNPLGEDDFTCD